MSHALAVVAVGSALTAVGAASRNEPLLLVALCVCALGLALVVRVRS